MKIIISGAMGAMGLVVGRCAPTMGIEVVAGVSTHKPAAGLPYPVYSDYELCPAADAIIDFSHPSRLALLLSYAKSHHLPTVIATTGMSESDTVAIRKAAQEIPIFFTFNTSLGVNLLCELARYAARVLGQGFDVEVIEKHHNKKIDAPSGTAIMIADAVAQALPYEPQYVYDRHEQRRRRDPREVGIHSVRGGTIVGEHEVLFCGPDEVITLSHSASSKAVFATGALKAAVFLTEHQQPGLYDMKSLLQF